MCSAEAVLSQTAPGPGALRCKRAQRKRPAVATGNLPARLICPIDARMAVLSAVAKQDSQVAHELISQTRAHM
jgi:hypothetical protein